MASVGPEDNMGVGGVRRIEVTERERPVFGGTEFGAVGPYERLHGTVFGELDPIHRLNVGIVNLDRAARNTHGNVDYQSDFRILKPLDLDRGNGCLVYDVPNRGNQPIMPRLNGAPDLPSGAEHAARVTRPGLGATLTTLYLQFETEAEAALGLPPCVHSYALLPIGYPMGRFGPVRRIALADVVYQDRWGQHPGLGTHCHPPNLFADPRATAAIECGPLFQWLRRVLDAYPLFSDAWRRGN